MLSACERVFQAQARPLELADLPCRPLNLGLFSEKKSSLPASNTEAICGVPAAST